MLSLLRLLRLAPVLNLSLEPGLQLPLRPLARGGGSPAGAQSQGGGDEKAHCSQAGSYGLKKENNSYILSIRFCESVSSAEHRT